MQKVGVIQAIWRYPVKGMAGESLKACRINEAGLHGDRTWAVQDIARQEIQSCKFRPALLRCRARQLQDEQDAPSGTVELTFPEGDSLGSNDPAIHECISRVIGHASRLESLRPLAGNEHFYQRYKADADTWLTELKQTFEREAGEPLPDLDNLPAAMQQYVSLPGTFFLVSPLHLLTTASLEHMRALNSAADWDIERFRPNLVVETLPGLEGLVEQGWLGRRLQIGDLAIDCVATAPRCGAITRAQGDLPEDRSMLRSVVKEADQNLGIYGSIKGATMLQVGDEVWVG